MKLYDLHSAPFDFQAGAFLKFATSAALADFDDREVENGGVVYVESYRDYFQKIVESPAPAASPNLIVPTSTGNAAIGVVVSLGGKAKVTGTPTLTATTQQVQMDGANTAIPPLVAGAVTPAAVALTSWAEWVALGRKVQGNGTGSLIAG